MVIFAEYFRVIKLILGNINSYLNYYYVHLVFLLILIFHINFHISMFRNSLNQFHLYVYISYSPQYYHFGYVRSTCRELIID